MADKKFNDNKEEITDAEIVSDTAVAPVDDLKNIENLINANIQNIDKLREDIKPVAEMIESLLDADLEYAELDQKAKEAAKERSIKKKELTNTTNGRELNEKLKSLRSELKEAREALSSYLQEYQKRTGFNEYESPDGELRQIVFTVKLVKKSKLSWD
jgi:DNA repair exonuclease SbcCD ATPase subunit